MILPKGWSAFGGLLLLATLLSLSRWRLACGPVRRPLLVLTATTALVVAVAISSMAYADQGWRSLDNISRLLLIPWCAALAYALAPSRSALWYGALAGICIGFSVACAQMLLGVDRAGAGNNPIVFANAMLTLLVLAVYCRPSPGGLRITLLLVGVLMLGIATIVMSGSRGVLPGLALLVLIAIIGGGRRIWLRSGIAATVLIGAVMTFWFVPALAERSRLAVVQSDLHDYARGHVDTSIGTRLEYLALAGEALVEHPWTGVGIDRFDTRIRTIPACRHEPLAVCHMGHAHNDIAQWGATMGIPGVLAILAIYLVPLAMFVRLTRAVPAKAVGAAWAGVLLVLAYMMSGLTQAMFAHALSATNYVVFTGVLLGLAWREAEAWRGQNLLSSGALSPD